MSQQNDGRPSARMIALFFVHVGIMLAVVAITGRERGQAPGVAVSMPENDVYSYSAG